MFQKSKKCIQGVDTVSTTLYNRVADTVSVFCMRTQEMITLIKGTPDLIAQRREEIVNACEGLARGCTRR